MTTENSTGPEVSQVAVIATTTTSARNDISAAANLGALATNGGELELICEGGDLWLFFAASDAGTVDETATSGATRGFYVEAKKPFTFRVAPGVDGLPLVWMVHKCSAATKLIRIRVRGKSAQ
jgi:hypothetical protein